MENQKNLSLISRFESQLQELQAIAVNKYPAMNQKTLQCQHRNGCIFNIIFGFVRAFALGYGLKTIASFIQLVMQHMRKKNVVLLDFLMVLISKDTMKMALFPGVYNILQKSSLCGCRHLFGSNHRIVSFISGFVAGSASLTFLSNSQRKMWSLFLLARSLDTILISLQNRKIWKKSKAQYVVLMGLQAMLTGYAFGFESEELAPEIRNVYLNFGGEERADVQFRQCWHAKKQLEFTK